jgi:hypothetical protein
MIPKSFRITDEYSQKQFSLIQSVLKQYPDLCLVVYTSNWYITIACADFYFASEIRAKLMKLTRPIFNIDMRPGKKNTVRHYLRVQFHRE